MKKLNIKLLCFKNKIFFLIIAFIILCILVLLGSYKLHQTQTNKIGFEDIGELATQVAYCEEVGVTDEGRTLFGLTIPFTQSKYIYSYNVTIKAGYDFTDIDYKIYDKTKKIKVRLPKVKILGTQIDENSFKVYHEDESIFRRISLQENNKELTNLKQRAEKDAVANGLYENARSHPNLAPISYFLSLDFYIFCALAGVDELKLEGRDRGIWTEDFCLPVSFCK